MKTIILRITRKSHTNEWTVTVEIDRERRPDLTYFTDDHQDALDTRIQMANQFEHKGYKTILT